MNPGEHPLMSDLPLRTRHDVFEAAMHGLQWTQEWLRAEIEAHRGADPDCEDTLTELGRVHDLTRAQLRALYASATDLEEQS